MKKETLQETANRLNSLTGKVRGEVFLSHKKYIEKKEGSGGLKRLEEKMLSLSCPVVFEKITASSWQPEGLSSFIIIVAKEIFYWEEKDVFEMGKDASHLSPLLRLIIRNFTSTKRLFEKGNVYWKNLFDFGSLEAVSFDKNKKEAVLRIWGFRAHPLVCVYHCGYLSGLAEISLKKPVVITQLKSVFNEDDFDEYKISW